MKPTHIIQQLADSKSFEKPKIKKQKTCRFCGEKFYPFNSLQKACSTKCAIELAKKEREAKEKKRLAHEKKAAKEKLKTYPEWLNELQKVFNAYIRQRDTGCISCGTNKMGIQYAAGHFFSVGAFPNVRFDEDNVHKQCNRHCNKELSGNIHNYRPALIAKIGIERFEALELKARSGKSEKLSIPEIQEKIKYYKNLIKNDKRNQN